MLPWVEENVLEPCMIEAPVWHRAGFSGTLDRCAWLDQFPEVCLIDWKTSLDLGRPIWWTTTWTNLRPTGLPFSTPITKPDRAVLVIGRPAASKPDVWVIDGEELIGEKRNSWKSEAVPATTQHS